jgi:hypothetical protein
LCLPKFQNHIENAKIDLSACNRSDLESSAMKKTYPLESELVYVPIEQLILNQLLGHSLRQVS